MKNMLLHYVRINSLEVIIFLIITKNGLEFVVYIYILYFFQKPYAMYVNLKYSFKLCIRRLVYSNKICTNGTVKTEFNFRRNAKIN